MPDLDDHLWLKRVIALSEQSRAEGNHPFATIIVGIDGRILAEAFNAHKTDRTSHAEMVALRDASANFHYDVLNTATLYSSAEPCAMCAGAAYWCGIGRVVYALSERRLLDLTGSHPQNPTLSLPCRDVFVAGQRTVEVIGPLFEDEAAQAHLGFWQ